MRLATVQTTKGPRVVAAQGDQLIDLQAANPAFPGSVREILEGGSRWIEEAKKILQQADLQGLATSSATFLAPIPDPRKIVCLGLNYRDHAEESGVPIPREPVLFSKYATALTGHGQPIVLPSVSTEVDYEAELVIVIGKRGKHVSEQDAMSHVAGYTVGHDVSARDWQLKKDGKQWMVGKTFDTFAPTGPFLVTADEVPDPHTLAIKLRLNGQTMQDSNTKQMIFSVPFAVAYLSKVFTLEPGDLIFTGTPPGVGFAKKPPLFLKPGDVAEVEIEKLGLLRNPVTQGA